MKSLQGVFMGPRSVLLILPMIALAQEPVSPTPSPEVDRALRARVSEFFQDFLDGKFREAMDLVANDTKDEYFTGGKSPLKAYKIRDVRYSDDFTKAAVALDIKRI